MRRSGLTCLTLLFGVLGLPVVVAVSAQTMPAPASSTHTSASPHGAGQRICFDTVFYAAMPGQTNYCLGLRDWESGHYQSGLELLKLAAGWGNKNAQYTLGLIYYNGHHVAANPALGIAWLKLADQRHNDPEITRVAQSANELATPAQRTHAAELYARMRQHYGDSVATARAWHHLRHWERHRGRNVGIVCVYGQQAWALNHAGLHAMAPRAVAQAMRTAGKSKHSKTPTAGEGCASGSVSFAMQNHLVQQTAQIYFRGWIGTVAVGPLQQAPTPAPSSATH